MKKILLLVIFVSTIYANEVLTYKKLYNMSQDGTLNINKLVVLMVGATDCPYCHREYNAIQKNESFRYFLNKNFTFLYVNQDKDFLPVDYYAPATPAFFILNPFNLRPVVEKPAFGAIPLDRLKPWLMEINNNYQEDLKGVKYEK